MDVGGLNGALLDPMSMTDAELLDVPSLPDIEESLGVDKLDDVQQVLAQTVPNAPASAPTSAANVDVEKISDLEKQISEKDAKISTLNAEISTLKEDKSQLSEKVELFEDETTDLRDQFSKIESSNEQLKTKINELEKLKDENALKISKLEEEAKSAGNSAELDDKLTEQIGKTTALENKIKQMETDSAALTKRNQDLIGDKNKKISELNADIVALKASVAEKEAEIETNKTHFEQGLKTEVYKNQQKDDYITTLQKTISDLKESNAAMAEKEKEIADLNSKMEEMRLKQRTISEEKTKLESDNKLLNEKVSKTVEIAGNNETLQTQIDGLKASNDTLQADKNVLQEQIMKLNEEAETLKKEVGTTTETISQLKDQKEVVDKKLLDVTKVKDDISKQLDEMKQREKTLETEKSDLAAKLSNNEQKGLELTLVQTQLSETQKREAKLKSDVATLTEKVTSIDAEKQLLSSEMTKAVSASKMFEEQLKNTAIELDTTKKHKLSLEQAAGNYTKLSHEKAAADQRCIEFSKRCGDLERKVQQMKTLEQQVMGLNNANIQMKNEVHQARNEVIGLKQHNDTMARECSNYKNQVDQNNKYMRDYSIQNGELQKKNIELSNALKAHEVEVQRLKSQNENLSKQASHQADYGSLKSHVDSLTKVLAETKQEAITFR